MMIARFTSRKPGIRNSERLKAAFISVRRIQRPNFCQQQRLLFTKNNISSSSNNNNKQQQSLSTKFTIYADRFGLLAAGGFMVIIGGAAAARLLYSELLDGTTNNSESNNHGPRRSRATVLINIPSVDKSNQNITPEQMAKMKGNGQQLHEVSASEFASFLAKQRLILNTAKKRSQNAAAHTLKQELNEKALEDTSYRVSLFSKWYFAYPTTYKLLGIAMTSATRHAVTLRTEQSLGDAVSHDIQDYVCRKYEAIVLRPAVTNTKIHSAFVRSLRVAHEDYLCSIGELEESVASFVLQNAKQQQQKPQYSDVVLALDWIGEQQKIQHIPTAYEKSPEMTIALITAGTATGKIAGGAVMGAAAKAIAAKLTAPFAAKAVGAATTMGGAAGGAGAAVGAAAAGAMAGPVVAAAGMAIGIGVDVTVNAGVSLMQKGAFERDVRDALDATVLEWEGLLVPELERVQNVWFDHAEALLDASSAVVAASEKDDSAAVASEKE